MTYDYTARRREDVDERLRSVAAGLRRIADDVERLANRNVITSINAHPKDGGQIQIHKAQDAYSRVMSTLREALGRACKALGHRDDTPCQATPEMLIDQLVDRLQTAESRLAAHAQSEFLVDAPDDFSYESAHEWEPIALPAVLSRDAVAEVLHREKHGDGCVFVNVKNCDRWQQALQEADAVVALARSEQEVREQIASEVEAMEPFSSDSYWDTGVVLVPVEEAARIARGGS
jgi:hypothetical protein